MSVEQHKFEIEIELMYRQGSKKWDYLKDRLATALEKNEQYEKIIKTIKEK